jgi:hypothetical protein
MYQGGHLTCTNLSFEYSLICLFQLNLYILHITRKPVKHSFRLEEVITWLGYMAPVKRPRDTFKPLKPLEKAFVGEIQQLTYATAA